jgi:hypothetical protein
MPAATVLLVLDLMHPGGHHYPLVLFGDNVTQIANNEIPLMCPIVLQHGINLVKWLEGVMHATLLLLLDHIYPGGHNPS